MSDDYQPNPKAESLARFDAKYKSLATLEIIQAMAKAKTVKEDADEVVKAANAEYDYLRLMLVPARFEEEGIQNMKVAGIGRVSLTGDLYVSTKSGAKDALFQWLRDNGREDLIQEGVNASTLKASVRKMIVDGEELPTDDKGQELLNVTPFTRASITRA